MDQLNAMAVGTPVGVEDTVEEGTVAINPTIHCQIHPREHRPLLKDYLMWGSVTQGRNVEMVCFYEDFVHIMGLDLEQS